MNTTEKTLEMLNAEKMRLLRWVLVPYVILFVVRLALLWATGRHFIEPRPAGLITVVICLVVFIISLPYVIKMDKIHKQIRKVTKDNAL